jgi:short-subunit dehydrogenase
MIDHLHYESKNPVVIVTGASSGLGLAFARLLDETLPEEISFWLIARDEEKLRRLADGMQRGTRCFSLDLKEEFSFAVIEDALRSDGATVQLLGQQRGGGDTGSF